MLTKSFYSHWHSLVACHYSQFLVYGGYQNILLKYSWLLYKNPEIGLPLLAWFNLFLYTSFIFFFIICTTISYNRYFSLHLIFTDLFFLDKKGFSCNLTCYSGLFAPPLAGSNFSLPPHPGSWVDPAQTTTTCCQISLE